MTGPHRYERNLMSPAELIRLKAVDRAIHLAETTGAKPSATELVADAEVIRGYITRTDAKPAPARTGLGVAVELAPPDGAPRVPKPGEHLRGIR